MRYQFKKLLLVWAVAKVLYSATGCALPEGHYNLPPVDYEVDGIAVSQLDDAQISPEDMSRYLRAVGEAIGKDVIDDLQGWQIVITTKKIADSGKLYEGLTFYEASAIYARISEGRCFTDTALTHEIGHVYLEDYHHEDAEYWTGLDTLGKELRYLCD